LSFANYDRKEAKQWRSERSVYDEARNNGWSKDQMNAAWSKAGISDEKLKSYATGWQAEQDYRNSQLITVGIFGAPIVAIAGVETGALSYLLLPSADATLISSGSNVAFDGLYQLASTGKINPIQSIGSALGPLSYAITSSTTINYSTGSVGINPATSASSLILSTGVNALGGAMGSMFIKDGLGAAAGGVGIIPTIWSGAFQ